MGRGVGSGIEVAALLQAAEDLGLIGLLLGIIGHIAPDFLQHGLPPLTG